MSSGSSSIFLSNSACLCLKFLYLESHFVKRYHGVNHAFTNPSGDRYAPDESKDAWDKTLEFFKNNLN